MKIRSILKHTLIAVIYGLLCVICWEIGKNCCIEKEAHDRLPTIEEIQKQVGVTPDSKLGKTTENAWNRAINNQYAQEYFR